MDALAELASKPEAEQKRWLVERLPELPSATDAGRLQLVARAQQDEGGLPGWPASPQRKQLRVACPLE